MIIKLQVLLLFQAPAREAQLEGNRRVSVNLRVLLITNCK